MRIYLALLLGALNGEAVARSAIGKGENESTAREQLSLVMLEQWPISDGFENHRIATFEDVTDTIRALLRDEI